MNNFINLLRRKLFTQNNKVMYGRWSLDYEQCTQDRKVYLTNMDHCGCCENEKAKQSKDYKNLYDIDNDYKRPFLL
jgi:hypothetical protein